ncbi:MAG: hypothetical protein AAF738_11280, partial [Bacteroidota bacterium]
MNDKQLKKGLRALPEYEPSGAVWENIAEQLPLQEAIGKMSTYEPSAEVWENIASDLPVQSARVRRLWQSAASIAALLAITLGMFWWTTKTQITETTFYAKGLIDTHLFQEDWNEDEASFKQLNILCQQKAFVCNVPTFRLLKTEFDELNKAKLEVEQAMTKYGQQGDFILQMKDIEQE